MQEQASIGATILFYFLRKSTENVELVQQCCPQH